ncbi:regulator of G-protein signaling 17 [Onthophagus taurus]|uniref:regulator of G-protein signaling 17 n=1 Tax=Onthophagus taurus TaxID=166361 RepID=UPI000C1FFA32|nr:regulator of G-protein signaling 17 [Onthophagus taurus]
MGAVVSTTVLCSSTVIPKKMSCGLTELVPENRAGTASCRLRGSNPSLARSNSKLTSHCHSPTGYPKKPCCLYWCCCCSCICNTSSKSNEDGLHKHDPLVPCDGEPVPSLDEIRSWGRSFDKLMKSSAGRKVFREFLRCEYSEENILFWLACEDLKKETNPEAVEPKARVIYEDYISILSPKEVSLDSRVREIVNRNMVEPSPHTFDEAQLQIYTLMHRDSYPRFVNSPLYKSLAQQTNETDAETPRQG